ncbi:MAG: 50S ribosomal protein L33 [Chrysiogenetes bacterium]|nr:50S ribosomal protein L33 [Chrysiogenetes bacterium]
MASDHRIQIGLKCSETGIINYVTMKNKNNTKDKLELMKFSPKLRKHTLHKECKLPNPKG